MSAQKSPEFDSQDDSSEGGYADDYAVPRQSPIVAWNLYCTGVLPALKRHALRLEEQGVIVLPNAPMSLFTNLIRIRADRGEHALKIDDHPYLQWWFESVTPIIAGVVIVNRKFTPREEDILERAIVGKQDLETSERREPNNYGTQPLHARVSVDSTKLSTIAQSRLIMTVKAGQQRLKIWSLPAIAVLAANDLLKSMASGGEPEETAYLAGTLNVTMHLWRKWTPALENRRAAWVETTGMLTGSDRSASLLVPNFNIRIRKDLSLENSEKWDREAVASWRMPDHLLTPQVMAEIRSYMPRRSSTISSKGSEASQGSPKRARNHSRSPARSLAKSPFTPQPRWHS